MAPPGRWKGIAALLVCVHCSLTVFAALGALLLGGAAVPVLLGVRIDYIVVPVAILALFSGWLWWGWRASRAEVCEVPAVR